MEEQSEPRLFEGLEVPCHIGIIMDGNGRWAKERGLPRNMGHRAGSEALKGLLEAAVEIGGGGVLAHDCQVVGQLTVEQLHAGRLVGVPEAQQRHAALPGVAVGVVGQVEAALAAQVEGVDVALLQLAQQISRLSGSRSEIVYRALPTDDPKVRQPDITKARRLLKWEPKVDVEDGLTRTIDWCRKLVAQP